MMKKFFALVLALVLSLSLVPAHALTVDMSSTTCITYSDAEVLLAKSGRLVGATTPDEARYLENVGVNTDVSPSVTVLGRGRIQRAKAVSTVELNGNQTTGGTSWVSCYFVATDGVDRDAAEVLENTIFTVRRGDQTAEMTHRFVTSDSAGTKIGEIHFADGGYVSVFHLDWDGENGKGNNEFALRAGTNKPSNNSGSTGSAGGSGSGSTGGSGNGDRPPVEGSNNTYNDCPWRQQ